MHSITAQGTIAPYARYCAPARDCCAWLLLLLVACPVLRFLSVLLRNVGRKEALNEEQEKK